MFAFTERFDRIDGGGMTLRIIEKNPGDGEQIPFYYYDILADGVPVGRISIRIGENFHSYYNGHIGYEIFPEHQGRGYAGKACKLVLEVARFHGMRRLYLTCGESNAASYRTIEKLGARLLEICPVPERYFGWYEGIENHRIYQLDL